MEKRLKLGLAAFAVSAICAALSSGAEAQGLRRESPREMRRIIAQAICLGESYIDTTIAKDSAAVVGVYVGALGGAVTIAQVDNVRALAREAKPATPTPVGGYNLAIARCIDFAARADVARLLGGGQRPKGR